MGERSDWIRRALDGPGRRSDPAPEPAAPPPKPEASIAPGCELTGNLQLEGPLTVYGDLVGSIDCQGDVTIAVEGTVQGAIQARSVEVRGSVVGPIDARREIVLLEGARLHGDVKTASFVVERGAVFEGRSERREPIAKREAPAPVRTAAPPREPTPR